MHRKETSNQIQPRRADRNRVRTEAERQKRERSLAYRILTVLLPVAALLLSTAFALLCFAYTRVRPVVTIELGEGSPKVSAFLRTNADAVYKKEPEAFYVKAGSYRLWIRTGALVVPVALRVADTVAPTAEGLERTISTQETLTPDKLIKNLRDQSIVKATFETAPEFGTVGDYETVVLLEDASGNRTRVPSAVHVRIAADAFVAEAGGPAPKAEDFLIGRYDSVQMDAIPEAVMREPGEYPIRITADGAEAQSTLIVRDTVPPTGRGVTFVATPGSTVSPEDLVTDVRDETAVTATFETQPDPFSLLPQTVGVILKDRGGNETTVYGTLLFSGVKPVKIEAHEGPLQVSELQLGGEYTDARMSWQFEPTVPGLHVLTVLIDGKENLALIDVGDTTPPAIELLRTDGYLDHPQPAETFAKATDVTGAAAEYRTEPDWTKESQSVTVTAEDAAGNRSERTFTLTLQRDTEPPELYGVVDRTAYVGEPIAYLAEVYAEDNADGRTAVTVDSGVRLQEPGSYEVTFTTVDTAGNRASASCRYELVEATVSEDEVRALAQDVLGQITTDKMVTAEKLKAVFDYVRTHVRYVGNSDKTDWRKEAVRGFRTGKGDCFTFYAVTRALLDELGVEYMSVTRLGGRTRHYWTIVNIGTGWYHFDTTISSTHTSKCFMWTNEQCQSKPAFWRYDQSRYPDIATDPFDYKEVVRMEKEGLLP